MKKILLSAFLLLVAAPVYGLQTVFLDPSLGSCTDPAPANTGTGTCTVSAATGFVISETFTFTATTSGSGATFSVTGSITGAHTAIAAGSTVSVTNTAGFKKFSVNLSNGGTNYAIGDNFQVTAVQGTQLRKSSFDLFDLTQVCANGCSAAAALTATNLTGSGNLSIAGTAATGALSVTGAMTSTGQNASTGGVGAPAQTFVGDLDTGSYDVSDGVFGIASNGASAAQISSALFRILEPLGSIDGNSAAPGIAFTSDVSTGYSLSGANLRSSVSGVITTSTTPTSFNISGSDSAPTYGTHSTFYFNGTVPSFIINPSATFTSGASEITQGRSADALRIYGASNAGGGGLSLYSTGGANAYQTSFRNNGTESGYITSTNRLLWRAGSSSTSIAAVGGVLKNNTSDVGNILTGEDDLHTYSIPANVLASDGDSIMFTAGGFFANNSNNKTVKCYFGATALVNTGPQAFNNGYWSMSILITRTGATTQRAIATFNSDLAVLRNSATYSTPGETLSGAVTIKCTGDATATNDIIERISMVEFKPVGGG